MVDRNPEKFLSDLNKAFHNRPDIDTTLKPQYMFFFAAKSAVAVRLTNLDALTEKFPEASKTLRGYRRNAGPGPIRFGNSRITSIAWLTGRKSFLLVAVACNEDFARRRNKPSRIKTDSGQRTRGYRGSSLSEGRAGAVHGGDRLISLPVIHALQRIAKR